MAKKRKWGIVAASILLLGFIGFMAFAIPLAREAKRIGDYSNPDIQASLEAIRRNPNDAAAHSSAAHYYGAHNYNRRYDALIVQHLREVIRIEPQNSEAKFLLAHRLKSLGHNVESQKLFRELAQQQDDWGKAAQKRLGNTWTSPDTAT